MGWTLEPQPPVLEFLKGLGRREYARVDAALRLLEEQGPHLQPPYVKLIRSSRHRNMKELRVTVGDSVLRIIFAIDSKRRVILLTAGNKAEVGYDDFYDVHVPIADAMFDEIQAKNAAEKSNAVKGDRSGKKKSGRNKKRERK